jgi:hypothetical protein
MPKSKASFLAATSAVLVAAGMCTVFSASQDPAAGPKASAQPAATAPAPAAPRVFVEQLAPSGPANARIRVGMRAARTVSLNLDQLSIDQSRYVDDLVKAKQVVVIKGRQQTRHAAPPPLAVPPLKLTAGRETVLVPFAGLPALDPAVEKLLISNCLMITDLGVVEDAERTTGSGPWTFGTLMTNLANRSATGIEPAEFVANWLKTWEEDQTINSFLVKNRKDGVRNLITVPWQNASGGPGKPLDLTKAPFRLLAIASRLDLRDNLVLGAERIGGGGAGEARFVFCAVDRNDNDKPTLFTVIFEYQIKRKNFHDVREWAEQWYALKDVPLGTTRYNKALQKLTDQFAGPGNDPESPPNQSALSQLRTNEIALGLSMKPPVVLWEIREFRIDIHTSGLLRVVTVKQTPDRAFNDDPMKNDTLAAYINSAQADILAQEQHLPLAFPPGQPILGGAAPTPPNAIWDAPMKIKSRDARQLFSISTCSGCHAGETFPKFKADDLTLDQPPPHFTQVRPRKAGFEARLSPFLTGIDANGKPYFKEDPTGQPADPPEMGVKKRFFHDLSNRAADLNGLVHYGVIYESVRQPLQMVH